MKKRILCVILAVLMLIPFVLSAQATGSEDPSIAIWVNGNWVAAKSLSGMSGDVWVEFPIDAAVLKDSGEGTGATNYVRITSNVDNGSTDDTKLVLFGSTCGWSNTYVTHNWWVDDGWTGLDTINADIAIEGWNGSQWIRIHNDHDCVADTSYALGKVSDSDYQGYARNIWTENNTLANYTNFRIRAHVNIGTNLTVATGDILNLFPAANYHECAFCATCGGCTNANCTLNHTACSCSAEPEEPEEQGNPSVTVYVNGNWISAVSLVGKSGDQWIEFPINASALNNSADNYVRIMSNVVNGSTADTQVNLLCSNCGWSNSFLSSVWYVDGEWSSLSTYNPDIAIEGWNGTQWVRIHDDHDCVGDISVQLGKTSDSTYAGYARNIWVGADVLGNYTNFRIRAHMNIGTNLTEDTGDVSALFPADHYRDCAFCATCGGCTSANCTLNHTACTCSAEPEEPEEQGNPSVTVYVNGNWISAVSLVGKSGDQWIEFPINASALNNSADNYVRIMSNVVNGSTADTQVNLLCSNCGWSNSFLSSVWYVDGEWSSLSTYNPDIAIEGWNGTQWVRIHNDHDCVGDISVQLGKTSDSTYAGYARNIWVDADVLGNYTNFRIRAHMNIGTNLTEDTGDVSALFPADHYRDCAFCATCGGCTSANCTLNHVACTCGEEEPVTFAIKSAALKLDEDIDVIYTVTIPEDYTDAYMVINGKTITEATAVADGYQYIYSGITPQKMTDNISATLYATKDGATVSESVAEYSVKQYCSNMLTNHADDAKLVSLLSDLLTYGAAAQTYTGYNTDALATAGLTLTPTVFEAISGKSVSFTGTASADADWKASTLILSNTLAIRLYFTAASTEGLTVTANLNGTEKTFSASDFVSVGNNRYYVDIYGIEATQLDSAVTASFVLNGTAVGRTISYSANAYICGMQNVSNANLQTLVRALYNYGVSAAAYVAD